MNQQPAPLIISPPANNSAVTLPILRAVMPELDAVRGIALLAVLFYHGFYWAIDLSRFLQRNDYFSPPCGQAASGSTSSLSSLAS